MILQKFGFFAYNATPPIHKHLLNNIGLEHVNEDYNLEKFLKMQRKPILWMSDFYDRLPLVEKWLDKHVDDDPLKFKNLDLDNQ